MTAKRLDVFILQYVGEIAESVHTLMNALAISKSVTTNKAVTYCIIDGQDTDRLIKAYPQEFDAE